MAKSVNTLNTHISWLPLVLCHCTSTHKCFIDLSLLGGQRAVELQSDYYYLFGLDKNFNRQTKEHRDVVVLAHLNIDVFLTFFMVQFMGFQLFHMRCVEFPIRKTMTNTI